MPDESDEGANGEPTDGSEEPSESPDADPERGSPIDPSDFETRADDDGDGAPSDDFSADDAAYGDAHDEPADDGAVGESDDIDEDVVTADDTDDGADTGGDEDHTGEEDDTDTDTDEDDTDTDTDEDDTDTDTDEDDARGEEHDPDTDAIDEADTDESDDTADDAGRSIDGLDDWPSVKPDPVDLADEGAGSEADRDGADGGEPADGDHDDGDEGEETDDGVPAEDRPEDTGTDEDGSELEDADDADLPEAQTDGEGYVHGGPADGGTDHGTDESLGGISTPPDDQEMPLADHIEEMVLRLAAVLLIGAVATVIGLLGASPAIDYIWQNVLPANLDAPPHVYHPLELWLTRIKVAALLGILVALPMFVYQCYLFMRPGLYPNERKYYLSAVPMSLVLAVVGMFSSFVLVLPILFRYFTFYSEGSAGIAYALGETFNLIITLTGFLAIVFQIPLFIMLAIMMGVTTRAWLVDKRLYFWAAFFGLSFMFTMDPTLMAPIIVAIIMIVLFEGTLLLLRWTGRE